MKPARQYQVRLNGVLVFQTDDKILVRHPVVNSILTTLCVLDIDYSRYWIKEEQGDFVRDVLVIKAINNK